MIVLTAEQAAAVDRRAIDEMGIPGPVLMETAGRAVARSLLERWGKEARAGVAVLCGPGNNGGDGFVCARALAARGVAVRVFLLGGADRLRGDAALNHRLLLSAGLTAAEVRVAADVDAARAAVAACGVAVDALFGTGLGRPLEAQAADLVGILNESGRPVLAVDIPSGVQGTTGAVPGPAASAHLTVTMGFLKRGLLLYPGAARCGAIQVAEIGFPERLAREEGDGVELLAPAEVARLIPIRRLDAHKGSAGRVLIVAGSTGMAGAAILCTRGALRTGTGLTVLAVAQSLEPVAKPAVWEALTLPLPDEGIGILSPAALPALEAELDDARALALGPGLGRRDETRALVCALLARVDRPMVVDADALLALPEAPPVSRRIVVTPHPGEMSRLLGRPTAEIVADPVGAARECAARFRVVALLKGAHSVAAAPDGRVRINWSGNPGMASGGMGDVLTGMVASLLAQGADPLDAASAGAFLHGLAADAVAAGRGERGILAGDVAEAIPTVLRLVLEGAALPLRAPFPQMV